MKQFIVDRHTTPNTPTLEQVPTEKIPIYENRAAVTADLANLAVGQIVATKDTGDELSHPVNVVEEGNLHAVSSNAVAEKIKDYQAKEWKVLDGYNISGIEYDEIAVSVWFEYNNREVLYSQQYSKGMLGTSQTSQILNIGGYYLKSNDYGLCNLDFTNGLFELRNVIYAGQNFKTVSGLRIRYR